MVVCKYCAQTSYINANSLEAIGKQIRLADYGSILAVGKRGKLKGQGFTVLGRLRFDYEDGFWDEWLIVMDAATDKECWLQEDEGEFILFTKQPLMGPPPVFEITKVGTTLTLNNQSVFVTEKNRAVVNGSEGELPFRVVRGEKADFIDGITNGTPVSLEYMPGETAFNIGESIVIKDFLFV
jgi:hypothetical protein